MDAIQAANKAEAIELAEKYKKQADSLKNKFAGIKETYAVGIERTMRLGVTVVTAGVLGGLNGWWPGTWAKVDKEWFFAVPGVVLGMTGWAGEFSDTALAVGSAASTLLIAKFAQKKAAEMKSA